MTLHPCRECGQQVSTQAAACPHCGAPGPAAGRPVASRPSTAAKRRPLTTGGLIVLFLVVLVVAANLLPNGGRVGTSAASTVGTPDDSVATQDGRAACYEIEKAMNALATFTTTTCLPAKGKGGAVSFLLLSDASVFGVEKAEKAWLLVAVGAVGSVLNDQPSLRADEVLLSDMDHTRRRVGYVLPAASCRSLQRQVSRDQIDLATMYTSIRRQLVQREVTR